MIRLIILYLIFSWCYKEFKPRIDGFLNPKEETSSNQNNNKNDNANNKSDADNIINTFNEIKDKIIEDIKKAYEKFIRG